MSLAPADRAAHQKVAVIGCDRHLARLLECRQLRLPAQRSRTSSAATLIDRCNMLANEPLAFARRQHLRLDRVDGSLERAAMLAAAAQLGADFGNFVCSSATKSSWKPIGRIMPTRNSACQGRPSRLAVLPGAVPGSPCPAVPVSRTLLHGCDTRLRPFPHPTVAGSPTPAVASAQRLIDRGRRGDSHAAAGTGAGTGWRDCRQGIQRLLCGVIVVDRRLLQNDRPVSIIECDRPQPRINPPI